MKTRGFEVVADWARRTDGEVKLPERGTSKAMAYDFYANTFGVLVSLILPYGWWLGQQKKGKA